MVFQWQTNPKKVTYCGNCGGMSWAHFVHDQTTSQFFLMILWLFQPQTIDFIIWFWLEFYGLWLLKIRYIYPFLGFSIAFNNVFVKNKKNIPLVSSSAVFIFLFQHIANINKLFDWSNSLCLWYATWQMQGILTSYLIEATAYVH